MSEVSEQYTQAKSTRMSGGSERRRKRNRTKHWLIVAVACFQTNHVSAQNEHPLLSEARGGIGYWRIEGQYKMDFFGDGETERRNRALKKSAKNERESSSTKRSKKSSKSSKKSSSSNSSNDLVGSTGGPVGSFLELQRHGYHHPTKPHSPGSQPWSKSRRQPTATPSTVTIKPSLHPSSSPTHPIVSSKPSCGSTSIITGSPSEVPSYLRVPSNRPSSEQISSQAPTTQPKSGSPSLFGTSSVAPSSTPIQSQEPSSNATSTSFPSDPRSSSPSPTTTVAPKKSPSPTSNGNPTLSPSDYPSDQQSLSPTRTLAPSKISSASPPSTMPTMLPSSSYFPSEQPINNSTLNPTTIPTQSPNREDAATASPTRFTIKRRLPQFTLEYEIVPFDAALQNELSELESITSAYLRKQVLAAVSNGDVLLVDFLSNYIFFESEPDVAVVRVTFESIAFFDPMTPVFPTEGEMIEQILDAFTGEEMTGYTGLVQALPSINTFSSSTHIFLMETLDAVDAPLTKEDVPVRGNGSVTPFVITAAASLLLLSVVTAFWAHGRRRRRRREASEKFINGIVAELKDTTSSRFSATYATDFGDAHQIMEDDDWTMQDIETTEYGTLLHESQNGVNKNHDNTGGKYRRNDKRKKFTRTEMEETQDSFDELMKKAIGESTLAVFESASSSEEHLSVVAEDETSQSSTSPPAAVENHKDDTHICKSRRVPYFLREEG